jgi:exosortase D (VPLPA-CTERM-specific)
MLSGLSQIQRMPLLPVNIAAPAAPVGRHTLYRFPAWTLAALLLASGLIYLGFHEAIGVMVWSWQTAEFSHGYLIPVLAAYLIWQRRSELSQLEFKGSWGGLAVVLAGIALAVVGRFAALYTFQHIALLIVIYGLVLSLVGWSVMRVLAAPLGVLVFMIPLPSMLMFPLSSELQLLSSTLGVWLMRLAGVSTYLEGNVIDLGIYKLEVAEACSGLRYLLPLMTLAFLLACFFRAAAWKRVIVFLSSIPITLFMNSLRIAAIGVMVDRWGPSMAEGLLHDVQGWMMFMLSTVCLVLVAVLLARVGKDRRPWRELLSAAPGTAPRLAADAPRRLRTLPLTALATALAIAVFSVGALAMPSSYGDVPAREDFSSFPLGLGAYTGKRQVLERIYLDQLKLDDYLMVDYSSASAPPVNLYVAWYDKQSAGEATHSPRACMPGGGWRIEDLRQVAVSNVRFGAQSLRVNRALIRYDQQRELVYYWFQQRGRVVTNEYLVKWYLLIDSITMHRTDGALLRVIVPIPQDGSEADADRAVQSFIAAVAPKLEHYVPG